MARRRTRLPGRCAAPIAAAALAALAAFAVATGAPAAPQEVPTAPAADAHPGATPDVSPPPAAAVPAPARPLGDPFDLLERARDGLVEAGPQRTAFVQTFLPAGFASGEREHGRLAVALPDCLRWDYLDPYPKSFLICGETVHAWNPGEAAGRRDRIDSAGAAGLDLMLLSVERLRERYEARLSDDGAGNPRIDLDPRAEGGIFRNASVILDRARGRPLALSFHDPDGNLTRFELAAFERLAEPGLFAPPENILWQED